MQENQSPETLPPPAPEPARRRSLWSAFAWLRDLVFSVLIAVILIVFIYQPVKVEGTSMMPTLTDQERIFINKFTYRFGLGSIQRGDTVVFYDASNGSLRLNSKGTKLTVLVGGKYVHADSTLVPSDAYKGGFDVRDLEMARIFNAALDKGIHVTAIFDSCHSVGISRGI